MASSEEFVTYVCDQIGEAGSITYRKMFGDYGIYCNGKIIGLVCDNQFFLKKTEAARKLLKEIVEAPPYEGAKPQFLIEDLEDKEYLGRLIKASYEELPMQKEKKKKDRDKK
ncbi:MAG: TfoX/Sxy family protein [Clostridia bacterium]